MALENKQEEGFEKTKSSFKTYYLALIGIMAAVLSVIGPFAIPVGPIAITLGTFGVILSGYVLGPKYGTLSVVIYILLGVIGLPVFSGASGGIGKIIGPVGGYIIAFIFLSFSTGLFVTLFKKNIVLHVVGALIGEVVMYIIGTAWFIFVTKTTLAYALTVCVFPFLIGDTIKLAAAVVVGIGLRKKLKFLP
jgi:biotin transport system substrate-specific component